MRVNPFPRERDGFLQRRLSCDPPTLTVPLDPTLPHRGFSSNTCTDQAVLLQFAQGLSLSQDIYSTTLWYCRLFTALKVLCGPPATLPHPKPRPLLISLVSLLISLSLEYHVVVAFQIGFFHLATWIYNFYMSFIHVQHLCGHTGVTEIHGKCRNC